MDYNCGKQLPCTIHLFSKVWWTTSDSNRSDIQGASLATTPSSPVAHIY